MHSKNPSRVPWPENQLVKWEALDQIQCKQEFKFKLNDENVNVSEKHTLTRSVVDIAREYFD